MYQKLFQITIVLFFVVVSIVAVGMIVIGLLNTFSSPLLAHETGIVYVVGGVSEKSFRYMIVAASLLIAGLYLYVRRRRFRR